MDSDAYRAVDDYIRGLFAPHDEVLAGIEESMTKASMPKLSVTPNQGKLLYILALLANARRILEVGTLGGYSTVWMARALPDGGRLVSIDRDRDHAEVARKNIERAGLSPKVELRIGEALEILSQMISEGSPPFDMFFIDADKPPYPRYLELALDLSRPGTLIVADNVVRRGAVAGAKSTEPSLAGVQRFNEMLAADTRLAATIVQTVGGKGHDGIAIAVVKPR